MKTEKKHYDSLDLIRIFSCFAILLYHLNILKGGYLAVCSFFVLSGFLTCTSALKKEKFSWKEYYKNRIIKLYLPLLTVVFLTIFVVSFFQDIIWINLKPEVTSILFGYNNFWQLSANLDYFARHINSPFMHLWYISILLQFELIFPLFFLILKKIQEKLNKFLPYIITSILAILSFLFFCKTSLNTNLMTSYYNTFCRSFSLFLGISLSFLFVNQSSFFEKHLKQDPYNKLVFLIYFGILVIFFCFVDANTIFHEISMLLTSLITCRMIQYGVHFDFFKKENKLVNFLSKISYEIYLVQYPIIYFIQYINISNYFKYVLMILLLLGFSILIHYLFEQKKDKKILQNIIRIITLIFIFVGGYQYIIAKDHTEEMKQLEEQLAQNEIMMARWQEEYDEKLKQSKENLEKALAEYSEEKLDEILSNMSVIGVGDSVMLGAVPNLQETFKNGYFDAKISRTAWVINGILQDLKNKGMLEGPIILNVGANGDCTLECKMTIMETCAGNEVFWVNVTNDKDVHVNDSLLEFSKNYNNLHVIDWETISNGHPEYFVADGIHLTQQGREAYVKAIYSSIYNVYSINFQKQKEEKIKEYEEEKNGKMNFYGNDLLLNASLSSLDNFQDANYNIIQDYDFIKLKTSLKEKIANDTLSEKVVFLFDKNIELTKEELEELMNICIDHKIYILSLNEKTQHLLKEIKKENIKIIDFNMELENNKNYMMVDKIHLTEQGNEALRNLLTQVFEEENKVS